MNNRGGRTDAPSMDSEGNELAATDANSNRGPPRRVWSPLPPPPPPFWARDNPVSLPAVSLPMGGPRINLQYRPVGSKTKPARAKKSAADAQRADG